MTKPTEQEPDRSGSDHPGPDRSGSADATSSESTPVWDGADSTSASEPASASGSGSGSYGAGSGEDARSADTAGSESADGSEFGDGVESSGGYPAAGRSTGGNGRTDDVPPRLPPPWERVPAAGVDTAATTRIGGDGPSGDRYGSATTQRLSQGTTVTDDPEREPTARRPVSPELGEARTTEVDSRSIWSGQPNPPPGGFPAGWPRNRRPRQANLQLKRLDPWSVLKIALVLAVVLYLVWMVAVGVLYGAMDGIGVWDRLNGQYADLVSQGAGDKLISAIRVFGVAAVVGAVNSLLVAVAFSVSAFIYNVSADLVGGIEVTLSERD